ncbi:AzlD domain-containing protein [Demequina sp. B12]|uniref:AzlD domain-containing protein n=1 Tax=Demequina sp. B12 TaxID=2992757 RepID=UPI00237BD5E6|nr:AzlD domain-containing protein [Demequina sp. B12]MDE0571874.1 AzlD domain-containing protein [Demequina sp. B12]
MMTAFIVFTVAAAGTYLIRLSGIALLGGDRELSPRVRKALSLVAPAAMAAIIANSLFLDGGQWRAFGAWHLAAAVAVGVALWKRSMGWTLSAGAAVFAALLLAGL